MKTQEYNLKETVEFNGVEYLLLYDYEHEIGVYGVYLNPNNISGLAIVCEFQKDNMDEYTTYAYDDYREALDYIRNEEINRLRNNLELDFAIVDFLIDSNLIKINNDKDALEMKTNRD